MIEATGFSIPTEHKPSTPAMHANHDDYAHAEIWSRQLISHFTTHIRYSEGGRSDAEYFWSPIHLNTFETDHTNIGMTSESLASDEE